MGLGLASCLLAAGETVHLHVRRRAALAALRRHGIQREGLFGPRLARPEEFEVSTDPSALPAFGPEVVLICTKSPDLDAAATALARVWGDLPGEPGVVACMNGWGAAERLARDLPPARIFNATITTGFRRHPLYRVHVTVHGADVRMGSLFGGPAAELAPLCDALTKGGLPSAVSDDMEAEIWAKLLYNCALNPLAALLGVAYGSLGENPASRRVLETVVGEIFAVLAASGRRTKWPSADAYLDFFFRELLPPTRDHESSMLQDLRAGRPTEIDALNGAVARLGQNAGVATPVNAALATLVRSLHPSLYPDQGASA